MPENILDTSPCRLCDRDWKCTRQCPDWQAWVACTWRQVTDRFKEKPDTLRKDTEEK
jgi:hypothetical protein